MIASRAFVTTFREQNLIPSPDSHWDSQSARAMRYLFGEGHYTSTLYSSIHRYAARLRTDYGLYRHIRSIHSPVHQLVEFDVSAIYGGNLDFQTLEKGAVPILMASEPLKNAIRQTWLWSNWRAQKSVYVRHGAMKGDVFLWVADDTERRKVVIEVMSPEKIKDFTPDAVGNVKAAVFEYVRMDENGKEYLFRLEVDQEWFRTFRENHLTDEWPNLYGFVPLVHVQHMDVGMQYGAYCFHGSESLIDEMNDAASVLNDAVRKSVTIVYYGAGVKKPTDDLVAPNESRDGVPIIYGPEGTTLQPLTPQIDIAAAGGNLERMQRQLEVNHPELGFLRLREGGNLTAPGVRAGGRDILARVDEMQSNYDDGYIRAQKMAVSIGGYRGYDNFQGFDLDSYAAGKLEFYIKERPLVDDSLGKNERVQAIIGAGSQPLPVQKLIYEELDVDQARIDEAIAEQQNAQTIVPGLSADDIDGALRAIGDLGDEPLALPEGNTPLEEG